MRLRSSAAPVGAPVYSRRAVISRCEDLIRLGSEREVKAQNLARQEHKEYIVQEGDILLIRHN